MDTEIVQSLADKMDEAFSLSLQLCYETLTPDDHYFDPRNVIIGADAEFESEIGCWCDGLVHKYYQNMTTGHCSLDAMVKFDIEKFENKVDSDIAKMRELVKSNPIRKMTSEEMKRRGYKGY